MSEQSVWLADTGHRGENAFFTEPHPGDGINLQAWVRDIGWEPNGVPEPPGVGRVRCATTGPAGLFVVRDDEIYQLRIGAAFWEVVRY